MAYLVFARRWRPQRFDEVVGQSHITTILKNAIGYNRLAHAYLFSGPRGVGKTSTARIFARSLNCVEGPTVNACNTCAPCKEVTQGTSLDVLEIDGASNRGIDEIRQLRENVQFQPSSGKFRIYIIDEVHMLTAEAFNALLKTLEEPPRHVKFIFATTQAHKVPLTILSRCQRFDFRRISAGVIREQLAKILKGEGISVDESVLQAISHQAQGSMRDAESILDQLLCLSKEKISLSEVNQIFGLVDIETFSRVIDRCRNKDLSGLILLSQEIFNQGKDVVYFINGLIEYLRNVMLIKIDKSLGRLTNIPMEYIEGILRETGQIENQDIVRCIDILMHTLEEIRYTTFYNIPLEISLIKMSSLLAKDAEPKSQAEDCSMDLSRVKSLWPRVLKRLEEVKISLYSYIAKSAPISMEGNKVLISVYSRFNSLQKDILRQSANIRIIEDILSKLLNKEVVVRFQIEEAEHSDKHSKKSRASSDSPKIINSALNIFGGNLKRE